MLKKLDLVNFRCFEKKEFSFSGNRIAVTGGNGLGKTSVLEAIYFCSNLRSFRTSKTKEMKKLGTKSFSAEVVLNRREDWNTVLKVEDGEKRILSEDGVPVRRSSDFISHFRTVCFLPDDPLIVTGAPSYRRHFMDMFLCMTDPAYFKALQNYVTALKNRNALLKKGVTDARILLSYAVPLSEAGSFIVRKRIQSAVILEKKILSVMTELRPSLSDLKMTYHFSPEMTDPFQYREKMEKDLEKDLSHFSTQSGPHLDDFDLSVSGKLLKYYGSRGQCRIVSLAMKLAELELLYEEKGKVTVLADDALSDLDAEARKSFLSKIAKAEQIFYAFTELPENLEEEQVIKL